MKVLNIDRFNEKMKIIPLSDDDFERIPDYLYKYSPETKNELRSIICKRIEKEGNDCDLNDIDVSKITDMSCLFKYMNKFNGDISKWDVSNVETMKDMFFDAESFNGDISGWDVSNVKTMQGMFFKANSFNQDLSGWNASKVENTEFAFILCPLNKHPKKLPNFNQT